MSKCKTCNGNGVVGQIISGQREFGGDGSTYHETPCPDCNPQPCPNCKDKIKTFQAQIKGLKETINYAIGGIDALLPDNEDAKAIKKTLEK